MPNLKVMLMAESVADRFLRYVKVDTQSQPEVDKVPSTDKQFILAKILVGELKALGLTDAEIDEHCYIMATLPASPGFEDKTVVGFMAHMDTSSEVSGDVKPMVWKGYGGKDMRLPREDVVISPQENPELDNYVGQDIITADGTSLLGADDKAGVEHGKIRIAFTPDEEVGKGTEFFDVEKFGAAFAFTIDGGEIGEVENETFNAATATVKFKGYNVHPGYAKDKMKNAMRAAGFFITLLPQDMAPETTEGWEGYLHPYKIKGAVEEMVIKVLVRDFTDSGMKYKKAMLEDLKKKVSKKFPGVEIDLDIKDSYQNMKVVLDEHPHVLEIAMEAVKNVDIEPKLKNIRGGTDGARLCFMGLPTPNLFAGGHNFHGKKEFIPIQSMEKAVEAIIEIARIVGEK
jgi:tripeptide aminopeptidase